VGLRKIVEHLQNIIDTKKGRRSKHIDAVENLVGKLEKKEHKLKAKLEHAHSDKDLRKIERHLKVCAAQIKKGRAALKELKAKSD